MRETALQRTLGLAAPIIQAPMAGVSTPALAAAVSNAGGLGSISVATVDPDAARAAIQALRAATAAAFNVNVFCHAPPVADAVREAAWLAALAPTFSALGAAPPERLQAPYRTFLDDDAMLDLLVAERPPVVSLHFGLPSTDRLGALRKAGVVLLASATNLREARAAEAAGVDAVVAQGYEAGGHRGVFDPSAPDERLGTMALVRILAARLTVPVIAAGGIMDGAGIAAALRLGASAVQMGTAFVACPESSADAAHRAALLDPAASTVMTAALSGRLARCLVNRFTALAERLPLDMLPDYPIAYAAAKALQAAGRAAGQSGYGAQLAGQGAPLARALPAAELIAALRAELEAE
jgi:nitronate monooxygenase